MLENEASIQKLIDLTHTLARPLLESCRYPWEALSQLHDFILALGPTLPESTYICLKEDVWVARTARIAQSVSIQGPAIIGERAELRHGAFLRGDVLIGNDAIVGNSVEVKNAILSDWVEVPHYNYVGDSILGFHAHMGAGSITSNFRLDAGEVKVSFEDMRIGTGRDKFGTILGDYAQVGCNAVLNPGTILGRGAVVFPLMMVTGCVDAGKAVKPELPTRKTP